MIRLTGIARRILAGLIVTEHELGRLRSSCFLAGGTDDDGLAGTPAEVAMLWDRLGRPDDAGRPTTIFETTKDAIE